MREREKNVYIYSKSHTWSIFGLSTFSRLVPYEMLFSLRGYVKGEEDAGIFRNFHDRVQIHVGFANSWPRAMPTRGARGGERR